MSYRLDGKVAIITGSSSGMGEATALHLAKLGALVTLCGRNGEKLESVKQKCVEASDGKSDRFLTVLGDVCESEVRNRIVDETVAKFGRLDIIVANAGMLDAKGSWQDLDEESYDTVLNTNLKSVVFLLQRATPHLIATKGSIVTISSVVTEMCTPSAIHYTLAKAALDNLARILSVVLGPKGVRVNNIRPGLFPTELGRDLKVGLEAYKAASLNITPLKRLGETEEIAQAVGFLVSDNAKFISGATLDVDGAMHLATPTSVAELNAQ